MSRGFLRPLPRGTLGGGDFWGAGDREAARTRRAEGRGEGQGRGREQEEEDKAA